MAWGVAARQESHVCHGTHSHATLDAQANGLRTVRGCFTSTKSGNFLSASSAFTTPAGKFNVAVGGITRNVGRIRYIEMLPGYAPFGKVALVRSADKSRFMTPEDLNKASVRVIKNPGGTNEAFVLENLKAAQVSTHDKNAEIPGLIAEGKGDVMITETYEALHYSKADPRLHAAFIDAPLTPTNQLGFMIPADDADYARVMSFVWELLDSRGVLKQTSDKWLK